MKTDFHGNSVTRDSLKCGGKPGAPLPFPHARPETITEPLAARPQPVNHRA